MLTLYDYLPSQNGYKVRLLLGHLGLPWRLREVALFSGAGQQPEYLAINPTGAVPALQLDDGRVLTESNAILQVLAEGTCYLPTDAWERAQVARWMYWEEDYIQNGLASLRFWALTGKLALRAPALLEAKRAVSIKSLLILERWLSGRVFLATDAYTIADMCVYAYVSRADEAGLPLHAYPAVARWVARVQTQNGFVAEVFPYSRDPDAGRELP